MLKTSGSAANFYLRGRELHHRLLQGEKNDALMAKSRCLIDKIETKYKNAWVTNKHMMLWNRRSPALTTYLTALKSFGSEKPTFWARFHDRVTIGTMDL